MGLSNLQQSLIVAVSVALIVAGVMMYAAYHNSDPATTWASVAPIVTGLMGLASKELGGTTDQGDIAQQVLDEVNTLFGQKTTAPTVPAAPAATATSISLNVDVGTYQGWTVKIVNGFLNVYPPAAMAAVLGSYASVGSVAGWPANTNWLTLAEPVITALTANYQTSIAAAANPQLAAAIKS